MTLGALLTFFGILVAILAVARPVQRLSLRLFVPWWPIVLALMLSFGLIVCRDAPYGVKPPFRWPLAQTLYWLTVAAFLIPVRRASGQWFAEISF
jgi:hypothetical protein